jgi:hypothetical protein
MIFQNETLLLIVGTIFPILFAGFVFFDPRRIYAPWAKLASVFVAIAGLGWGSLGFLLMDPQRLHTTRHVYFVLLACKHSLSGIVLGFKCLDGPTIPEDKHWKPTGRFSFTVFSKPRERRQVSLPRFRPNQSLQLTADRRESLLHFMIQFSMLVKHGSTIGS